MNDGMGNSVHMTLDAPKISSLLEFLHFFNRSELPILVLSIVGVPQVNFCYVGDAAQIYDKRCRSL